jgi:hypothetical protein
MHRVTVFSTLVLPGYKEVICYMIHRYNTFRLIYRHLVISLATFWLENHRGRELDRDRGIQHHIEFGGEEGWADSLQDYAQC